MKSPDVVLSSKHLLTEPWRFPGLSDISCELLWLWILQSVPNFPTVTFSTEILPLHTIQMPIRSILYWFFLLFIWHWISPCAVSDFLWSWAFSEKAPLCQHARHCAQDSSPRQPELSTEPPYWYLSYISNLFHRCLPESIYLGPFRGKNGTPKPLK